MILGNTVRYEVILPNSEAYLAELPPSRVGHHKQVIERKLMNAHKPYDDMTIAEKQKLDDEIYDYLVCLDADYQVPPMSQNLSELEKVGKALHGEQWQQKMANDLSVNPRTVRNWVSGRSNTPKMTTELKFMLQDKIDLLKKIQSEL